MDIYSKLLHTSTASAPLAPDHKALKDKVEWERTFEVLKALREVSCKNEITIFHWWVCCVTFQ